MLSGFVYLHSFTTIPTFLRKEAAVSLGSCLCKVCNGRVWNYFLAPHSFQSLPSMCWVPSFHGLLASMWKLVLGFRRLTKSTKNLSVLPRSFPSTGRRSTASRDLWIFWELAVCPTTTRPYRELVIWLAPPWFHFIEVDQGRGYAPAWCSKFSLKIRGSHFWHHVVVSSQDGQDLTRFKAINTTTFYYSERVLHKDSDAHACMYKTACKLQYDTYYWYTLVL